MYGIFSICTTLGKSTSTFLTNMRYCSGLCRYLIINNATITDDTIVLTRWEKVRKKHCFCVCKYSTSKKEGWLGIEFKTK